MERLAGFVLPKNVLGIFLMLRLVHFLGSCKTDTFTSMSNGKQKISAQCRRSFHVTSFKAVYSHGDIFRQNSTARRPGSSAWLCFNAGNFWLRFVGIFHTMHQRAEKLRIIIPTHEFTCAEVQAFLCFLQFKHYPLHLLLKMP